MHPIELRSSHRIRRLQQAVQAPLGRGVAAARQLAASELAAVREIAASELAAAREIAASELAAAREIAASELAAARDGLPIGPGGSLGFRKWLGWKLYRVAARVNPEIGDL